MLLLFCSRYKNTYSINIQLIYQLCYSNFSVYIINLISRDTNNLITRLYLKKKYFNYLTPSKSLKAKEWKTTEKLGKRRMTGDRTMKIQDSWKRKRMIDVAFKFFEDHSRLESKKLKESSIGEKWLRRKAQNRTYGCS